MVIPIFLSLISLAIIGAKSFSTPCHRDIVKVTTTTTEQHEMDTTCSSHSGPIIYVFLTFYLIR